MSVTLYTTAWGGYWEKYGQAWTKHIENLDPKPDRVIIVSDRPIETLWEVILTDTPEEHIMSHYRNVALNNTDTEWIIGSDLDDIPYSFFLNGLDEEYDICAHSIDISDGTYEKSSSEKWNNLFELNRYINPITSCVPVKTELIKKVGGYPELWYEDAGLWIKLRMINAKIKFDPTPRYLYVINENSLSHGDVDHKYDELMEFFNYHKSIYNSSQLG